jgi:hypothetical protein
MGTNNYTDYTSTPVAQSPANRFDQYFNGLVTDLVPRNSSGIPTASAGKNGTPLYPWAEINTDAIVINGTPFDPNVRLTDANQINSGATRSGSEQPLFLQADGSTNALTILATTTDLKLTINSVAVTFDTDVAVSSLTVAPSSNNTCDIDNSDFSDQEFTKYVKEIAYDNAGSEITSLDGQFAAFKKDTEYFIAKIDNTNSVLKVYQRGFFFDDNNDPIARVTLADNDTITLMQLAWIYADDSGSSASVGYTTPTYSASQPVSAVTNDYWFDLANEVWKRYDGAAWQQVDRILIGYAVIDSSNCVATRCIDFSKEYKSENTFRLEKATDSTLQTTTDFENKISVYGNNFFYNGLVTWDMATDLESGLTEASNTTYYFYITNTGAVKISDEAPDYFINRKGAYHPFHTWRFVAVCNNDSSSDLSQYVNNFRIGDKEILYEDSYFVNAFGLKEVNVFMIGGGGSGVPQIGSGVSGTDSKINEDFIAEGGVGGSSGGAGGSTSGVDIGYDGGSASSGTGGLVSDYFQHKIQISQTAAAGNSDANLYGNGGGSALSTAGGAGGMASHTLKLINDVYFLQVGQGGARGGGANPGGAGANGVIIIQL